MKLSSSLVLTKSFEGDAFFKKKKDKMVWFAGYFLLFFFHRKLLQIRLVQNKTKYIPFTFQMVCWFYLKCFHFTIIFFRIQIAEAFQQIIMYGWTIRLSVYMFSIKFHLWLIDCFCIKWPSPQHKYCSR